MGVLFFLLSIVGCSETRMGLGEACLKDGDCVSNYCSASVCIAEPPVLTDANATDTNMPDGAWDGAVSDASFDGDADGNAADAVSEAAI